MNPHSDPERGMRTLMKEMYIQKKGLDVLSKGGVEDSQRRADPMRILNEVKIEFLERVACGSLKSWRGI